MAGKLPPMPDIETLPSETRSRVMSAIRSKNTGPELALAVALVAASVEFECHCPDLPGKPDFVFREKKLAVFVDSAFWHGRAGVPKTNSAWWEEKLKRNRERDAVVNMALEIMGWLAVRLDAEATLENPEFAAKTVIAELEAR